MSSVSRTNECLSLRTPPWFGKVDTIVAKAYKIHIYWEAVIAVPSIENDDHRTTLWRSHNLKTTKNSINRRTNRTRSWIQVPQTHQITPPLHNILDSVQFDVILASFSKPSSSTRPEFMQDFQLLQFALTRLMHDRWPILLVHIPIFAPAEKSMIDHCHKAPSHESFVPRHFLVLHKPTTISHS